MLSNLDDEQFLHSYCFYISSLGLQPQANVIYGTLEEGFLSPIQTDLKFSILVCCTCMVLLHAQVRLMMHNNECKISCFCLLISVSL